MFGEKPLAGMALALAVLLSQPQPTTAPTVVPAIATITPTATPTATPEPTKAPKKYKEIDMGAFMITAYCPCYKCCGDHANGITATGTKAKQGRTIAVDPDLIPYGTRVKIGKHWYTAEDCGGKIKNKHIDMYFNRHSDADEWGVKYKKVKIKAKRKVKK